MTRESDIVEGLRLRFTHGLHPGDEIVVKRVTAVNVQFCYAKNASHRGKDNTRRYRQSIDWIVSHTEVVE